MPGPFSISFVLLFFFSFVTPVLNKIFKQTNKSVLLINIRIIKENMQMFLIRFTFYSIVFTVVNNEPQTTY